MPSTSPALTDSQPGVMEVRTMGDWQTDVIAQLREVQKRAEREAEDRRRAETGAPAFWSQLVGNVNAFVGRVEQECGEGVFRVAVVAQTPDPVTYKTVQGAAVGGLSLNGSRRQLTQTLAGRVEQFELAFQSGAVVAIGGDGTQFDAETLTEYFVRAVTGLVRAQRSIRKTNRRAISFDPV